MKDLGPFVKMLPLNQQQEIMRLFLSEGAGSKHTYRIPSEYSESFLANKFILTGILKFAPNQSALLLSKAVHKTCHAICDRTIDHLERMVTTGVAEPSAPDLLNILRAYVPFPFLQVTQQNGKPLRSLVSCVFLLSCRSRLLMETLKEEEEAEEDNEGAAGLQMEGQAMASFFDVIYHGTRALTSSMQQNICTWSKIHVPECDGGSAIQ